MLKVDVKLGKWTNELLKRIVDASDPGWLISIGLAGVAWLSMYMAWEDWWGGALVAVITFAFARPLLSWWNEKREGKRTKDRVREEFERLSREEKGVVQAFVWHGGSVMTWAECEQWPDCTRAGIESLMNRGRIHASVTADGMRETFVLDSELFDYGQWALPEFPF